MTLIFLYIHRLGSLFWVQNFEFQYFLGFSEKWIFFGYEDFADITKLDYRGHFYAFSSLFLGSRYRIGGGGIFGGCLNFKYFLGVPEIPENFWGEG